MFRTHLLKMGKIMRNLVVPNCNWVEHLFQEISNILWNQQKIIKVSKAQLEWQRIRLRNDVLKNKIASCNKVHGFHKMFPSLYACSFAVWLCSFSNPELDLCLFPWNLGVAMAFALANGTLVNVKQAEAVKVLAPHWAFLFLAGIPFITTWTRLKLSS